MDISELRREYTESGLRLENLKPNPFDQFELWFQQATAAGILEANAMSLATVSAEGEPSQRTVLLKYLDAHGLVFFTNLESVKAHQIAQNNHVSLLFLWSELGRQVVIAGTAAQVAHRESLRYFLTRPRGSQIGAWVSQQSHIISSRTLLEQKFDEMKHKFADGKVPLPSFWGGYRVRPITFEFWQGAPNRLHDRFLYSCEDNAWKIERLAP